MIYFVRAGSAGPVKIGKADNVKNRVATFQTGHYEELFLWRVFEGDMNEEAALHVRFRASRLRGEWFSYHEEMAGDLGLTEIFERQSYRPRPLPGPVMEDDLSSAEAEQQKEPIYGPLAVLPGVFHVISSDRFRNPVFADYVETTSAGELIFFDTHEEVLCMFAADKWVAWCRVRANSTN